MAMMMTVCTKCRAENKRVSISCLWVSFKKFGEKIKQGFGSVMFESQRMWVQRNVDNRVQKSEINNHAIDQFIL